MNILNELNDACNYIEENICNNIDINTVASITNQTADTFNRFFTSMLNMTVKEYIRKRRLSLAVYDLQNSKDSVTDIAFKYGFNSYDSFCKAFTAQHNVSPTQARNENCEVNLFPPARFEIDTSFDESKLTVRLAKVDDYKDICKISCDDLGYNCNEETVRQRLIELDNSNEKVFVADYDGKVVGYLHAQIYKPLYFEQLINFLGLAVSKQYRHHKIATKLVNEIEKWAKSVGASKIRVNSGYSRKEAHNFYRSLGYTNEKEQIRFLKEI